MRDTEYYIGYKLLKAEYSEEEYMGMIDYVNTNQCELKETEEYYEICERTISEIETMICTIRKDKRYLIDTDYIVTKLAEAQIYAPDSVKELVEKYKGIISEREAKREEIRCMENIINSTQELIK